MWRASVSKKLYFDLSDVEETGPSIPPSKDSPAESPAPPPRPSLLPEEISSADSAEEDPPLKRIRRTRNRTPPFVIQDIGTPEETPSSPHAKGTVEENSLLEQSSPADPPNQVSDLNLLPESSRPAPATPPTSAALKDLSRQLRDISEEELQHQTLPTVCGLLNATLIRALAHQREISRRLPGVTCTYQEMQRLIREHTTQLQSRDLELQSTTTQLQEKSSELQHTTKELNSLRKEREEQQLRLEQTLQELEELKKSSKLQNQEHSHQLATLKAKENTRRERLDAALGELAAY